jgi:hypothetical protein
MRVVISIVLLVCSVWMLPVVAQPTAETAAPQERVEENAPATGKNAGERRRTGPGQETRKLLEQVMIARLSKELSLDDEQTVLLVRRFAEQKQEVVSLNRERQVRMRELSASVQDGKDEGLIEERLAAVRDIDTKLHIAKTATLESLGEGLTPWQRARLYLFLVEFESDMKRLLQKARERNAPDAGEGRRGGGNPPEAPVLEPAPAETPAE